MPRIDAAHQLALVEPQADGMIGLPRSGLPPGFLARHYRRQTIEVGHYIAIHWFVEREQPSLVRQKLPDGNLLLALLSKFRPVPADRRLIVEPASGMGDGLGHCRQSLGRRPDDHHRVLLPRLAHLLVSDYAPACKSLLQLP